MHLKIEAMAIRLGASPKNPDHAFQKDRMQIVK